MQLITILKHPNQEAYRLSNRFTDAIGNIYVDDRKKVTGKMRYHLKKSPRFIVDNVNWYQVPQQNMIDLLEKVSEVKPSTFKSPEDNKPIMFQDGWSAHTVGARHYPGALSFLKSYARKHPYVKVKLVREPHNKHDANAIAVIANGIMIGHLPRYEARMLAPVMDSDKLVSATPYRISHESIEMEVHVREKSWLQRLFS